MLLSKDNQSCIFLIRVGRQVINIPSFMVRVECQKHIDFANPSPLGRLPGRVKRKNLKAAAKKAAGGDGDGDEEGED